ncbi:MAG: Stp1/IreP family PP2C-type Ser/Thr phosphatase [Kiritimatiellaeota bacterium]|nr:Stp1/IreP family PP2C-type Ser/Thr phosphatase [Kiritimatiellota bacterium]
MKSDDKNLNCVDPFNVVADSHTGLIREKNEDSYLYRVAEDSRNTLVAVADGIGGHEGGDIASGLCMRMMATEWRDGAFGNSTSVKRISDFLRKNIKKANHHIFSINKSVKAQHPMGTTVVAAVLLAEKIIVAHAGDSRCYRLRNGMLTPLTEDHSYVAELVRNKLINIEDARNHPFSHIISRSVGPVEEVEVEVNVFNRKKRDRYLLCSDGLTAHLNDIEIETILYDSLTAYDATRSLIQASLRGGGEDNITVICVFT